MIPACSSPLHRVQSKPSAFSRWRVVLPAVLFVLAMALSACSGSPSPSRIPDAPGAESAGADSASAAPDQPGVNVLPADGTDAAKPADGVVVTAQLGTLQTVTVTDATGRTIDGRFSADKAKWTSSEALRYSTKYKVASKMADGQGNSTTKDSSFSTAAPKATAYPSVIPLEGETVGVGMPLIVTFSAPVKDHAATEKLLTVKSTPAVVGAWRWFGDREVRYRPQAYWPGHTEITLNIDIGGADLGGGVAGQASRKLNIHVGPAIVTTVSNQTKQLQTTVDGRPAQSAPVSLGKPATPSASGTLLVMTVQHPYTMNSATFGVPPDAPGGYLTTVDYALRLTNSGQFLHSAPWSVEQQGNTNVSHGCINISEAVAKWFFDNSHRGDVVQVVGTEVAVSTGDGWTDWQYSWAQWTKK